MANGKKLKRTKPHKHMHDLHDMSERQGSQKLSLHCGEMNQWL